MSWSYWLIICILGCILLGLAPIRIKPKEQLLINLIKLMGYLHWVRDAFRFQGSLQTNLWMLFCVWESHWRVVFVATLQGSRRQRPEFTCPALRSSQVLGAGRSWPSQGHFQWGDTGMMIIVPWNSEWILRLSYLPQKTPPRCDQRSPSHQWLTSPKLGE